MIDMNNFNTKVNHLICNNTCSCMYLILKVLELLHLFVKYGYYSNLKDIKALMPPLISLLNGVNDKPFPGANDEQSIPFRKVNTMIKICITYTLHW